MIVLSDNSTIIVIHYINMKDIMHFAVDTYSLKKKEGDRTYFFKLNSSLNSYLSLGLI